MPVSVNLPVALLMTGFVTDRPVMALDRTAEEIAPPVIVNVPAALLTVWLMMMPYAADDTVAELMAPPVIIIVPVAVLTVWLLTAIP